MDAPVLHFFTGENTYALSKELSRWKQQFISKHGPENLLLFNAKDHTLSDILDAVSVMPFIAEKRLVILEGIPKIEKEDFISLCSSIHPSTVLVIVEPKPDKRLGIVKEIERVAEKKIFSSLSPAELRSWLHALLSTLGSSMTSDAERALLSHVGSDQWTLEMELRKIAAGSKTSEITVSDIDALAVPSGSQVIWKLTDLVGSKKSEEALRFLRWTIERGEDPYGLWSILLTMIKNLTFVFSALEAGHRDQRSIASATGLHPFAISGLLPLASAMNLERIHRLVAWASEADLQLKTGGYSYSPERPHEVILLTERAILMCSE